MKTPYPIIIAGGRKFNDYELLKKFCEHITSRLQKDPNIEIQILTGGAKGADTLGAKWCQEKDFHGDICPANWRPRPHEPNYVDKAAGIKRNVFMAEQAGALIAFWDGKSPGTRNMIDEARKRGLKVRVKRYDK